MSLTKMIASLGMICATWSLIPSKAGAFERFIGQSDKGITRVKNCVPGKAGTESFANNVSLNVALNIDLNSGDGLSGDDNFEAVFSYNGLAAATVSFDDISVLATASWVDSGIAITAGDTLSISATGSASPNGVDNFNSPDGDGVPCMSCVAVGNSRYSLVGRIGPTGTPFFIGSSFSESIFESGSLFLAFNDDIFPDNGGSFLVSGTVSDAPPLVSGIWSKIDERNGTETYQLTPSGDLTALSVFSGWFALLEFVRDEAGDACQSEEPGDVDEGISDLVKGTLVVKKIVDTTSSECDAACMADCGSSNCREATVNMDVRAFMNDGGVSESEASPKTDLVNFKYKARGYVVLSP